MPLSQEAAQQALPILMKSILEFNTPVVERIVDAAPELLLVQTSLPSGTLHTTAGAMRPIDAAIQTGQLHLLAPAVRAGWSPNEPITTFYGADPLPLSHAIGERDTALIVALLNHGANPNGAPQGPGSHKEHKEHLASRILVNTIFQVTRDRTTAQAALSPLGLLKLACAKGARFDMQARPDLGFPGLAAYASGYRIDYAPVTLVRSTSEWRDAPHVMVAATKLLIDAGAEFNTPCPLTGVSAFMAAANRKNILAVTTIIKFGVPAPEGLIEEFKAAGASQEEIAQIQAAQLAAITHAAVAQRKALVAAQGDMAAADGQPPAPPAPPRRAIRL